MLWGYYGVALWFLFGCYPFAMLLLCGYYVVTVWLLCGCSVVVMRLLCGCYVHTYIAIIPLVDRDLWDLINYCVPVAKLEGGNPK